MGRPVTGNGARRSGAGSDLASLRTSAVLDGDEWVVNGQKIWTSTAHLADWIFCLVRTEPDAPKQPVIEPTQPQVPVILRQVAIQRGCRA